MFRNRTVYCGGLAFSGRKLETLIYSHQQMLDASVALDMILLCVLVTSRDLHSVALLRATHVTTTPAANCACAIWLAKERSPTLHAVDH